MFKSKSLKLGILLLLFSAFLVNTLPINLVVKAQDPNLLGLWKFDEGSGTTAYDSSGYNNNGALYGTLNWVRGKNGSALSWPQLTNAWVEFPNLNLINYTAVTYSVWIKASSNPNRNPMDVIYHGERGTVEMQMRWDGSYVPPAYEIFFQVQLQNTPPNTWYTASTGEISSNNWHHLAGVWTKGGSVKLYVDGVKTGESAVPNEYLGGDPTGTFPGLIGAYYSGSNYEKGYEGLIDEVRIYDRALSDEEILLLKNEFATPNLLGLWKFDEGSGTTAYDSSGNNNDGTLNGILDWVPGRNAYALSWPGSSTSWVEFPNQNLQSLSAVTYSVWIKTGSNPDREYMDVIYHGDRGQVEMQMRWDNTWHWYEVLFGVTLQNTNNTWYKATTGEIPYGMWHHLAGVWTKGGSVKLYVDGNKTGELTGIPDEYLGGSPTGTFPGLIGAYYSGSNYEKGYEGLIDEVRIYDRALSDEEILLLKNEFGTVGGIAFSMDKFALLAPFIGLSSIIAVATVGTTLYVKRVKHRKEKQ